MCRWWGQVSSNDEAAEAPAEDDERSKRQQPEQVHAVFAVVLDGKISRGKGKPSNQCQQNQTGCHDDRDSVAKHGVVAVRRERTDTHDEDTNNDYSQEQTPGIPDKCCNHGFSNLVRDAAP